jgi:hypothetical protein
MGYYINPPGKSKEQWLHENGTRLGESPPNTWLSNDDEVAVCLVDNGPFTAAAVCWYSGELEIFKRSEKDRRYKVWYYVPRKKILQLMPELKMQWE